MRRIAAVFVVAVAALVGSAAPALASSGAQSLTIIDTGPQGTPGRIILVGPVTGVGRTVDTETAGTITVNGGTINVSHPLVTNNDSFNPIACLLKIDESGTYTLTGGTGPYVGISGSGTYHTTGSVVFTKTSQGCSNQPLATIVIVQGSGVTTLP